MRIVAALHLAEAIRAILACLGLPARAAPIAAAVAEREEEGRAADLAFDPPCE